MYNGLKRIVDAGWRVQFYPYGAGVVILLNEYGNDTRHIRGTCCWDELERHLSHMADWIKNNDIPAEFWVEGPIR